jgi:hypothetical protein
MPKQGNQRVGNLINRVRRHTEHLAWDQAKRVTWTRLGAAADEYTEWQGVWALGASSCGCCRQHSAHSRAGDGIPEHLNSATGSVRTSMLQ